ncbi:Crp/Fnr family transcriptional regulator [Tenacibaculum sp. MEBiC06402]|uniref:Crp/Fnr family transcriptional regulator n=1 Tax=unclassified Tenacibaculum TaxID=2635139 RepID=UPI003B9B6DC9
MINTERLKSYQQLREHIYNEGILVNKGTFKRDELIKAAGTIDTNVYFISSGSVKVYFLNKEEERILYFGYENSIITALDSFIANKQSELEIKAIKKTEVYCLSKKEFESFLNSNITYIKLWNNVLEDLVLYHFNRERALLLNTPKERYNEALERNPEIFQKIPHRHIASYLRMAPETLSRLKKS